MSYKGDIRLGDTLDFKFTTRRFSTGAPYTLAGSPAVSAYVDDGTTEITAGITLTADFDSRTGLNHVRVVASGANGFTDGTNVDLVITAGTVDSVSVVGEVIGSFSIGKRSALMPTTGGRTLDVTATGAAGIDWANVENPTTAVNLSATNIDTDQVVASVSGAVGSVTGAVGSVTAVVTANVTQISGDSVAADNAEAFFDGTGYAGTNNVIPLVTATTDLTNKGDGSGFTAVPWNAAWDAEVQSEVQDAIEANHLDHLLAATYDPASKPGAADALLNELVESDGGVARFTANALEQGPSGSGPTAADIADAVWDEAIADHLTGGSTGASLNAAGSAGDPWTTTLPGAYTGSQAGKILADILVDTGTTLQAEVDDIQSRLPAALVSGRMDANVGAVSGDAAAADSLEAMFDGPGLVSLFADIQGSVSGNVGGNVTGSVGDVLAFGGLTIGDPNAVTYLLDFATEYNTGSLALDIAGNLSGSVGSVATGGIAAGSFAANAVNAAALAADAVAEIQTGLATAANLATVAGYLDTEIAAILADTNELQTDWVNGGRLDLLVDAIKAKTDSLTFTVAGQVDANTKSINGTTVLGNGSSGNKWRG